MEPTEKKDSNNHTREYYRIVYCRYRKIHKQLACAMVDIPKLTTTKNEQQLQVLKEGYERYEKLYRNFQPALQVSEIFNSQMDTDRSHDDLDKLPDFEILANSVICDEAPCAGGKEKTLGQLIREITAELDLYKAQIFTN